MRSSKLSSTLFDRMGVIASAICLLHCAAVPLLAVALPLNLVVGQSNEGFFHLVLGPLVVVTALMCFRSPKSQCKQVCNCNYGFIFGAILVVVGLFLPHLVMHSNDHANERLLETILTSAGGAILIGLHLHRLMSKQARRC